MSEKKPGVFGMMAALEEVSRFVADLGLEVDVSCGIDFGTDEMGKQRVRFTLIRSSEAWEAAKGDGCT